ncbi:DUF1853 family protein [Marinimicrobium agarilyticum]|uniref:DUF1853 family protein n=1 Tax=Marinimicrobium agarilyticum TaxID=306546 RepID=UPI00040D96B4|nr:DUF1853 family protein [Marinimicrobium agarilyticum]
MTTSPDFHHLTRLRTPAIRHLAWMLRAPNLLTSAQTIQFPDRPQLLTRLEQWDRVPETAPAVLTQPPETRLGQYFERLYACLMTDLLGWELLGRNLPVRRDGRTLGELDFVLRHPQTGHVEHHEIAVKFYLGHPSAETGKPLWYGPNAKDRLDIKTDHMLGHQSRMTERPETRAALVSAGIEPPQITRLFMPGYLFYPHHRHWPAPTRVPSDHWRGQWRYHHALTESETRYWVPLRKPHWLGPWVQEETPRHVDTLATLQAVSEQGRPRLFAAMAFDAEHSIWVETERTFIVPSEWPAPTHS